MRSLAASVAVVLLAAVPPAAAQDADTRRLQRALAEAGYDPGPVDGILGAQTRAAIAAFQAANGLTAGGELGAEGLALLGLAAPEPEAGTPAPAAAASQAEPDLDDPALDARFGPKAPIAGDVGAIMETYARRVGIAVTESFRRQSGLPIVTTEGFPLRIVLAPPAVGGQAARFEDGEDGFAWRHGRVTAENLQGKGAVSFGLELYVGAPEHITAPDSLCRDLPANAVVAMPLTHFCVTAGRVRHEGVIHDIGQGNRAACRSGTLRVTNANRSVVFEGDAACWINRNPVVLEDGAWRVVEGDG